MECQREAQGVGVHGAARACRTEGGGGGGGGINVVMLLCEYQLEEGIG